MLDWLVPHKAKLDLAFRLNVALGLQEWRDLEYWQLLRGVPNWRHFQVW